MFATCVTDCNNIGKRNGILWCCKSLEHNNYIDSYLGNQFTVNNVLKMAAMKYLILFIKFKHNKRGKSITTRYKCLIAATNFDVMVFLRSEIVDNHFIKYFFHDLKLAKHKKKGYFLE